MASSAIVTGAASGIGRAVATRLAADGWSVVCVDTNETMLDDVVAEIRSSGQEAVSVLGDVTVRATHERACVSATTMGPLGAWVGVAGIATDYNLTTVQEEHVRRLVDINQLGVLWGALEALRVWEDTDAAGTIIAMSSVHARHAAAGSGVYEMTKAAVEALVRNIAVTYGPRGIRAVAVAPGAVSTPALEASFGSAADPRAARRHLERQAPLHRLGETYDVAAAVSFLASAEASFISGTTLTVDGAMSSVLMLPSTDPAALRPSS